MSETTTRVLRDSEQHPADPRELTAVPNPVGVHVALSRVMTDMPAVKKDGVNEKTGYRYRTIDSLLTALNGVLTKHGVVIIPQAKSRSSEMIGKFHYVTVEMKYQIIGPGGDGISAAYFGEASDVGDKATAKAQTNAFKYLMVTMLNIPVDDLVDSESSTPSREEAEREHQEHLAKAREAWMEASTRLKNAGRDQGMTPEQVADWYHRTFGSPQGAASIQGLVEAEEKLRLAT